MKHAIQEIFENVVAVGVMLKLKGAESPPQSPPERRPAPGTG